MKIIRRVIKFIVSAIKLPIRVTIAINFGFSLEAY